MNELVHQIVCELNLAIRAETHREAQAGKNGNWSAAARHSLERQTLTKFHGEVRRILKASGVTISGPYVDGTSGEQATASRPVEGMVLPLELALIRWSVVHRSWHEIGGNCPLLSAFLAGWCCRTIGASMPVDIGQFRDSFRCGWKEADDQITIASR
jgi:hypothetical protein